MSQHSTTALVLRTRDRLLAVPVAQLQEVLPAFELLRVAGMPAVMARLIGLRGEVLPVLDAAVLLGDAALELDVHMHFLVLEGDSRKFALLVEGIEDLVEIENDPSRPSMPGGGRGPFSGVVALGEHMALVLDVTKCAALDDLAGFDGDQDERTAIVNEGVRA